MVVVSHEYGIHNTRVYFLWAPLLLSLCSRSVVWKSPSPPSTLLSLEFSPLQPLLYLQCTAQCSSWFSWSKFCVDLQQSLHFDFLAHVIGSFQQLWPRARTSQVCLAAIDAWRCIALTKGVVSVPLCKGSVGQKTSLPFFNHPPLWSFLRHRHTTLVELFLPQE